MPESVLAVVTMARNKGAEEEPHAAGEGGGSGKSYHTRKCDFCGGDAVLVTIFIQGKCLKFYTRDVFLFQDVVVDTDNRARWGATTNGGGAVGVASPSPTSSSGGSERKESESSNEEVSACAISTLDIQASS